MKSITFARWQSSISRNWRTTLMGGIGFVSYLAANKTVIEPVLPEKYRSLANTVFSLSVLLGGYFATDKHRSQPADPAAPSVPPADTANG